MKFEANIPSYLRTGQGVFPVKGRGATKTELDIGLDRTISYFKKELKLK